MLVVEVDVVDAETLQRVAAGAAHEIGPPVDAAGAVRPEFLAELGREHHVVTAVLDRLSDETLVGVRTVGVRGIEQFHPQIEGPVDGGDGLLVIGSSVGLAHAHAAEA